MERYTMRVPDLGSAHGWQAHRAPDLPVPVDEPVTEPHPAHPDHPNEPLDDEPIPDHKPQLH